MKLYLDDDKKLRPTPEGWARTCTVSNTIECLRTYNVTELSLDNDLGVCDKRQGYEVADWIENECATNPNFNPPKLIIIHTQNSIAREKMKDACRSIMRMRPEVTCRVIPAKQA